MDRSLTDRRTPSGPLTYHSPRLKTESMFSMNSSFFCRTSPCVLWSSPCALRGACACVCHTRALTSRPGDDTGSAWVQFPVPVRPRTERPKEPPRTRVGGPRSPTRLRLCVSVPVYVSKDLNCLRVFLSASPSPFSGLGDGVCTRFPARNPGDSGRGEGGGVPEGRSLGPSTRRLSLWSGS